MLGTSLARDVFTSAGGDDPNNTIQEAIINPGDILVDPPYRLGGRLGGLLGGFAGGVRPLVLAAASALGGASFGGASAFGGEVSRATRTSD